MRFHTVWVISRLACVKTPPRALEAVTLLWSGVWFAHRTTKNQTKSPYTGGEDGIRTHDTVLPYTHFPGVRLQPLGHLSSCAPFQAAREAHLVDDSSNAKPGTHLLLTNRSCRQTDRLVDKPTGSGRLPSTSRVTIAQL